MANAQQAPAEPLRRSFEIQEDVSARGFDWPDISGVLDKVQEEFDEIKDALVDGDIEHARVELGDLLFSCVNLARFLDGDPTRELHRANDRFQNRFSLMEAELHREGTRVEECALEELDLVWERVKKPAAS